MTDGVRSGVPRVIELLLSNGADEIVNVSRNNGRTALHDAAYNGHHEICDLLLAHDANPNVVDGDGFTPLRLASIRPHGLERFDKVVAILKAAMPRWNRRRLIELAIGLKALQLPVLCVLEIFEHMLGPNSCASALPAPAPAPDVSWEIAKRVQLFDRVRDI